MNSSCAPRMPRTLWTPSETSFSGDTAASLAEMTSGRANALHIVSSRRHFVDRRPDDGEVQPARRPTLPYITSPRCSAIPKPSGCSPRLARRWFKALTRPIASRAAATALKHGTAFAG